VTLAVPAAISMLLNNAFRVIDQYAVQHLGVDASAAIGSTTFVLISVSAFFYLVSSGAGPLFARAIGGEDRSLQRKVVGNALTGALVLGLVIWTLVSLGCVQIASWVGLSGNASTEAIAYLSALAMYGMPLALAPTLDAIFISQGRTSLVMFLQAIATVLNIVLNPWLIYGCEMGIEGAALATGISRGVVVAIALVVLYRDVRPDRSDFVFDGTLGRILKIGWPVCCGTLAYSGVYWALLSLVIGPLGTSVVAALGVGFNALEGFTWPIYWGFSMAVASLVGRQLGAGDKEGAVLTYRLAFPVMTGIGLTAGLIFWFAGETLSGFFTQDPEVMAQATLYARILALSQVFVALEALSEGVLEGAGETKPLMVWSVGINLARVPLAWWFALPLGMGPAGVWWAINITTVIKCCGKWYLVLRRRWLDLAI
jgi:putative MATE family efflux protein